MNIWWTTLIISKCGYKGPWSIQYCNANMFCLTGLITLVQLTWKLIGLFLRKNHILRCWGCLSPLNWIGTLTYISIAKTACKKIGSSIVPWSFFLLIFLCFSINLPNMLSVWVDAPSCYLVILDKLQKLIYWSVRPSLAASTLNLWLILDM